MNTNIFRAYDIRGNAEKDLDSSTIEKIGYALGLKIKENNSNAVYVGYDSRLSCEEIKSNLKDIIRKSEKIIKDKKL